MSKQTSQLRRCLLEERGPTCEEVIHITRTPSKAESHYKTLWYGAVFWVTLYAVHT